MSLFKKPDSQYYWTRFYIDGREFKLSTGETDSRRAKAASERIRQEKRQEVKPVAQPSGVGTMEQVSWEDIAATIDRGTSPIHQQAITERWKRMLGRIGYNTPPAAITDERIIALVNDMKRDGMRGQSIRRYIAALRRGLQFAEKKGWITKLPNFPRIPSSPKCEKQRGKLIAPDVVRAVLKEVAPDVSLAAEFCVLTGLRMAEVNRARYSFMQAAPEGSKAVAIMRLPDEATKNKRPRTIGLSKRAVEIVEERFAKVGDRLFPHTHYSQALSRACRRLYLPYNVTMRDLRHTFASKALKASQDISAVSKALGHSELETTTLYLHSAEQDVVELAAHMDAIMGPVKQAQVPKQAQKKASKKPRKSSKLLMKFGERETGIEPATSCLGSTQFPYSAEFLLMMSQLFSAMNSLKAQPAMGPVMGPGNSVGPGNICSVVCTKCNRVAEAFVGPKYECAYCGARAVPATP